MGNAQNRIDQILQRFTGLSNWEERYKLLVEMGKTLPAMESHLQTEENKIKGCQSQVWLMAQLNPDKTIHFNADSDALIVKGLVALLLAVYQDLSPEEVLKTNPQFLKDIGLESHLSPSRANGLRAMVKQIQYYATAFHYLLTQQN